MLVRVDQETLDKAQEVFPAVRGRSGGVAYALRRLLYVVLDEPIPKQYGEVRRSKEIDDLEALVRRMETGEEPTDRGLLTHIGALLAEDQEPVDVLRLRAVAGRLVLVD